VEDPDPCTSTPCRPDRPTPHNSLLQVISRVRLLEHGVCRGLHSRARKTLEAVLAHRLHLGRCLSNAAKLRANAKTGGDLATSELTDVTVKVVIYEAFVEGKLEAPRHLARSVHDLYFEPKYEEFRSRTIWSLSNAFTPAFKDLEPIPQFKATAKLGEFLEARFSQSF